MPELPRPPRATGQLPLTKAHLFAMGALSLAMSALTFFIGLQLGRGTTPTEEAPQVVALLDEEARTGDLETLLMRVEASRPAETLVFPEVLPKSAPPLPPLPQEGEEPPPAPPPPDPVVMPADPPTGTAELPPGAGTPAASDGVPTTGWSIQVGTRADPTEARQVVETLRAAGLDAYHVSALVDGRAEHRVRVGGYASESAATAALPEIRGRAGTSTATVTHAP